MNSCKIFEFQNNLFEISFSMGIEFFNFDIFLLRLENTETLPGQHSFHSEFFIFFAKKRHTMKVLFIDFRN